MGQELVFQLSARKLEIHGEKGLLNQQVSVSSGTVTLVDGSCGICGGITA
jgi:hypothetical protein